MDVRRAILPSSIALLLALVIWSVLRPGEDAMAAKEAYTALCTGGANEVSPRVGVLCTEMRRQMGISILGQPWGLIAETSSAAAYACAPLSVVKDTPKCQSLIRQVDQLTLTSRTRVFPSGEPLNIADAVLLYQSVCGQGQAEASTHSRSECQHAFSELEQAQTPGAPSDATARNLDALSAAILSATRLISNACWPQGVSEPLPSAACQNVQWTWRGTSRLQCLPDLSDFQMRNLTETERVNAAIRYMRQPSLCFS